VAAVRGQLDDIGCMNAFYEVVSMLGISERAYTSMLCEDPKELARMLAPKKS
jgi:hypothetical protein